MGALAFILRASKRALTLSIAFLVFGFMDNFLMITAGSAIDKSLASFGFGIMFAAGLGNTLSDAVGIMSGRAIERWLGKKLPKMDIEPTKFMIVSAETAGIIIGCLLGMIPLAFL